MATPERKHDEHAHHHVEAGPGEPGRQMEGMARHEERAGHDHHEMMVADFRRRFWVCLVLTIPVLLLSPTIQQWLGLRALAFPGDRYVLLALAAIIYGYGGLPFLRGMAEELRNRLPGMMTLVAVAISAAFLYSAVVVLGLRGEVFFWESATLIDIMLLGHWLEMRSVMGASRALQELARLMPEEAHRVKPDGTVEEVPASALRSGDRVLIKPGERAPADGVVVEGQSSLDEALLTGESLPVSKGPGDEVIGGAINGEGALMVEVRRTGEESYVSQVIRMVEEAQQSKSRTQDLANRAAFWLVLVALGGGGITLATWLALGRGFTFALERGITVMVIACPHALGLAIPLVVAVSTGLGARQGLLIRRRQAFETARTVDAVVFDKTGTLTEGRFGVSAVSPAADHSEEEVLRLAAGVESYSEHPIAQGIVREAEGRGVKPAPASEFQAITGQGARAMVEGREVLVISPGAASERGLHLNPDPAAVAGKGRTVVYVVDGETVVGAIALGDVIRPESREAVQRLHALGIRVAMLTGDHQQVAEWVAEELGLDEYFAQVRPEQKAQRVRELQERGLAVGMVGDGINDAPALVQADIGIAIGAGTQVAIESADIVLVRNDPRAVVSLISLAKATWAKMRQNLAWATGYNVVAIPLAAGVLAQTGVVLSPAAGAALMSASTIIVAANARLLRAGGGGRGGGRRGRRDERG